MSDLRWPAGAYVAEFGNEQAFVRAVADLRRRGYTKMESYSSYPVHDLDELVPAFPTPLPGVVFLAGVGGALLSYWIQWFANAVSYPLNIGGRPAHAAPAFFIPTFEGTVLIASCAAFFGMLALLRLPRPWHPMFEINDFDQTSVDRYWVAIAADDPRASERGTPEDLEALAPVRVARAPASAL
jgi:hypothetical protein